MITHIPHRRSFLTLLGGAAAAWPLGARAQQRQMPVIGYFSARSPESDVPMVAAFRRGLNETGYVEGRNVAIEFRWGLGQRDHLSELAQELVRRQVAIIVTSGGVSPALAAKAATGTIPILFTVGDDPVKYSLVASLNRPGGNLTGTSSFNALLETKQLGLLRELVPTATTIGMLANPIAPNSETQITSAQAAARTVGLSLVVLKAASEREIDEAFASFIEQRAGALLITTGPFFLTRAAQLIALAKRHSVPAIYSRREYSEAGGLMSYASSTADDYRQLGIYTGRILKGEKAGDLPVMQPTKFELIINLKTAQALGLEIPPRILALTDEVIE